MADGDIGAGAERRRDKWKARTRRYVRVPFSVRTSDLPKRAGSALVMIALAVGAIAAGGVWLLGFISLVAVACFVEFALLVVKATASPVYRLVALLAGAAYIGLAAYFLASFPPFALAFVVITVIVTDTGAYFVGRWIGGARIAPRISPSKTWAGLLGGATMAALWVAGAIYVIGSAASALATAPNAGLRLEHVLIAALVGAGLAVAAQMGDFLESWMKRRAGVKDSSHLIPGHGGVFDRVDGLLPVALLTGLAWNWL